MGFWEAIEKVRPPQQTISDDAQSRLARRDFEERNRIRRVEYDDEGNELLWFDIVFSISTYSNIPLPWPAKDAEDARNSFIEWLGESEFITIDLTDNGAQKKLTFRGSWVSAFEIGPGRRRK